MEKIIKLLEYEKIAKHPLLNGAIIRNDFPGFRDDYLVIHCLIKKYNPRNIVEIGTSNGRGTNVICKAMGVEIYSFWKKNKVISIDVPPGTDPKIIYPYSEDGHPEKAGNFCHRFYTQVFGDSTKYDFSKHYPIESWFIDGKHNYEFAKKDTIQALKSNPKLIIWHDMQIDGVEKAVKKIFSKRNDYSIYRVGKTRIGFAVKK